MEDTNQKTTDRRNFLGTIAASAAAFGIATIGSPLRSAAETAAPGAADADAWFNKLTGKHKMVFDVTRPHELMPFVWPRVFLLTNQATGTAEKDNNVVVVLRHDGIPYAFEDRIWAKYKFGEVFKADDPQTKTASVRNPFWKPKPGDYKVPGFGAVEIGIDQLQASGVMFCVCDAAMTVFSTALAQGMNLDPVEVKKDWMSGLLPGVQVVPSGVWAVGRAQEHGCAYCFAG
ncbi:MAG: twin-arginine translocation signal domain-containing protein [Bacteroidetes bacterium]|nr:twin-arginine translocation signal domain-containing protein [Bacteroidota bacterium]